jgi:hypothetical protein
MQMRHSLAPWSAPFIELVGYEPAFRARSRREHGESLSLIVELSATCPVGTSHSLGVMDGGEPPLAKRPKIGWQVGGAKRCKSWRGSPPNINYARLKSRRRTRTEGEPPQP